MEEHGKTGNISRAAMKAGMDRKTAARYIAMGKIPSQTKKPRDWRTRADPFAGDWPVARAMLESAPELEGKALFEHLAVTTGRYEAGQLRTFQRRVKQWRARHGPEKEVFFAQVHVPGEALQTDFTHCDELGVTIAGEAFPHMLCHVVLPYSNWGWATVCQSESMAALEKGVQNAVFRLGRIPRWHQTDNSTAATHSIRPGRRGFNKAYEDFMAHLGMKPRTIEVGESHQNGDVEALNGALKKRLTQHLLIRGSSDFDDVADYVSWLESVLQAANQLREKRFIEELAAMRPLVAKRLLDYTIVDARVSSWSTIRVHHNAYSLPSRLIGEEVRVRVYEDKLQVWHGDAMQAEMPRLIGRNGHAIDYRHIIFWLVRKPGAFARYRYRESLFPTLTFRRAYDALVDKRSDRAATLEYLRILNLAATTLEAEVDAGLQLLLDEGRVPTAESVRDLVHAETPIPSIDIEPFEPALTTYDARCAMTANPHKTLALHLRALKLPAFNLHWEEVASSAEKQGWSFGQFLHHLAELEMERRRTRRIERFLHGSNLPATKTLGTLDLEKLPDKVRKALPRLCGGGFVDRGDNLLVFGLPGRGKTHVVCAIGHELVRSGRQVYFASTNLLVQRLLAAKRDLQLERELKRLDRFDAVILDDLGYVQQDRAEMEVLFTLLAERYERKSVIITSNLVFSQWDQIFKDPMTTAAAIDRVVHHSVILEMTNESIRENEAKARQKGDLG